MLVSVLHLQVFQKTEAQGLGEEMREEISEGMNPSYLVPLAVD